MKPEKKADSWDTYYDLFLDPGTGHRDDFTFWSFTVLDIYDLWLSCKIVLKNRSFQIVIFLEKRVSEKT